MKPYDRGMWWRKSAAVFLSLSLLIPSASSVLADNGTKANRVEEVLSILEQAHVNAPTRESLEEAAINAMVESLKDPYTDYFTAKELSQFTDSLENNYVGIGVMISLDPAGIYIDKVFEDSPALAAGLQQGDIITAVEGFNLAGKTTKEAQDKILGEEGSQVSITISRNGKEQVVELTRSGVRLPPVSSAWFEGGIGYIEVNTFSSDADELFMEELYAMKEKGLKQLIIDLRYNGGGLLDTARNLVAAFVEQGTLIHTRDRDQKDQPVEFSGGSKQPFPVYLLVNEYSASASEVMMGALQDYGVAKAVGKKTYGKGSVQNVFDLEDGGALKVTIEEYLTPKLRKVNNQGLEPDVTVEGAVPQLFSALRQAGKTRFDITLRGPVLILDGNMMNDSFEVQREGGRLYVPARVLAAFMNAEVTWNEATKSVQISTMDGRISYTPQGAEWLLKDGTGYVDIAAFAGKFKGLTWQDEGRTIHFQASAQ